MNTRNIGSISLGLASAVLIWSFGAGAAAGEPANQSGVIGKPFRISDSVKEYCDIRPRPMMCDQALPLLAALRAETRDPRWAAPMEALIAKSMQVGGRQWVQIRSLECRSTRCALEYAVYVNDLDHDVDGNQELERLMEPVGGIVAPEVSLIQGKGMMVSVLIWSKLP
jgi:hypothetical protein